MLGTVEDAIAEPFITAKPSDTIKPFASAPLAAFMKKYDCGFPIVKVYSDVEHDVVEDGMGRPLWEEYRPQCEIQIKFSKEDD